MSMIRIFAKNAFDFLHFCSYFSNDHLPEWAWSLHRCRCHCEDMRSCTVILLIDIFRSAILEKFFVTPTDQMFENSKTGPWSQLLDALVPGPNKILVNGPGPRCNGPWSLGPFGQWSLVPGPPFRVSLFPILVTWHGFGKKWKIVEKKF